MMVPLNKGIKLKKLVELLKLKKVKLKCTIFYGKEETMV